MTRQELDERIEALPEYWAEDTVADIKQLIRDCIEAVTPEKEIGIQLYHDAWDEDEYHTCKKHGGYDECDCEGFNEAIDTIKSNTKELLG